jgi:hypothetical protein
MRALSLLRCGVRSEPALGDVVLVAMIPRHAPRRLRGAGDERAAAVLVVALHPRAAFALRLFEARFPGAERAVLEGVAVDVESRKYRTGLGPPLRLSQNLGWRVESRPTALSNVSGDGPGEHFFAARETY